MQDASPPSYSKPLPVPLQPEYRVLSFQVPDWSLSSAHISSDDVSGAISKDVMSSTHVTLTPDHPHSSLTDFSCFLIAVKSFVLYIYFLVTVALVGTI